MKHPQETIRSSQEPWLQPLEGGAAVVVKLVCNRITCVRILANGLWEITDLRAISLLPAVFAHLKGYTKPSLVA